MRATHPTRLLLRRAAILGGTLLLFVAAGTLLIWPGRSHPDLMVTPAAGALSVQEGAELTVLRVRPGRRPTNVGRGLALADGRIAVHVFRGIDLSAVPASGFLLRADLVAMWQVATDDQRDAVRAAALALARDTLEALDDILGSPAFVVRYRPLLNDIFSDAIDVGWNDPETQAAVASASRTAQQVGIAFLVDDLRPVLTDRAPAALWKTLGANLSSGFGLFGGGGVQTTPIEEALDSVMRDDAVVDGMRRAIGRIAGSLEVDAFARALARSATRALNRDPRLQRVLVDIFRDPELAPQLRRIAYSGVHLLDTAQSQIAGLGGSSEINALAAAVFRGLIRGEGEMVLVLSANAAGDAGAPAGKTGP